MREQPASSSAGAGQEDGVWVMTDPAEDELVEDAEIDGVRGPSRFGGFIRGLITGGVLCGIGAVAVSLLTPLPDHLPGVGNVEIVGAGTSRQSSTEDEQESTAPEQTEAEPELAGNAADDSSESATTAPIGQEPQPEPQAQPAAPDTQEAEASGNPEPAQGQTPAGDAVVASDDSDTGASDQGGQPEASQADAQDQAEASSTDDAQQAPTTDSSTEVAALTPSTDDEQSSDQAAGTESESTGEDVASDSSEGATATTEDAQGESGNEETTSAQDATPPQDATQTEVETQTEEPAESAEPRVPELDGPALTVNARDFEAPEGAPLLAVVLEDAGNGAVPNEALTLMTMPLTLAIRANGEGARELAEAARGAGHEILAELPIDREEEGVAVAPGALASSVPPEQLDALTNQYLAELDLAVGATAPVDVRMLNNQRAMEVVLSPVATHGFAYVDLKAGIGSAARRIAGETGLVYVESNRYVPVDATEEQVYQMLEGASFQARRKGSAVVAVSASQQALKALVRWGLERGGQEVWFAPLSAVIARQKDG